MTHAKVPTVPQSELSAHIEMGVVELNVKDLSSMQFFYEELVGMDVLEQRKDAVLLGHEKRAILRLIHTPDLPIAPPKSAGLYHTAILFSSRSALAAALLRIVQSGKGTYSGSANHLVSEAFYFSDPEGNGLELYFDTPAETWRWHHGQIVMASEYLDPNIFIAAHGLKDDNREKKTGHVHLKVGDIAKAQEFYIDALGFYLIANMPSALFASDGTYHHNLGMNTWESLGAGERSESLGLRSFEFFVKDRNELEALQIRLKKHNYSYQPHGDGIHIQDPWHTSILVQLPL